MQKSDSICISSKWPPKWFFHAWLINIDGIIYILLLCVFANVCIFVFTFKRVCVRSCMHWLTSFPPSSSTPLSPQLFNTKTTFCYCCQRCSCKTKITAERALAPRSPRRREARNSHYHNSRRDKANFADQKTIEGRESGQPNLLNVKSNICHTTCRKLRQRAKSVTWR